MESKMIKIPFEVELAKKISNGEVEGRIVTRDGRNARIVCWDRKGVNPIVALVEQQNGEEVSSYPMNGSWETDRDLMLEVPEYMTFKDGDIVAFDKNYVGIFKSFEFEVGIPRFSFYAILCGDELAFCNMASRIRNIYLTTEFQKQKIVNALKVSDDPRAKECLKKLGIEEKPKCKFKPFDRVLVRDLDFNIWYNDIFSFRDKDGRYMCIGNKWDECIPYNEQTAHLLGTTENYE